MRDRGWRFMIANGRGFFRGWQKSIGKREWKNENGQLTERPGAC